MSLSLYTNSLFNSSLIKLFFLVRYFFSIFLSLTKWLIYLLFLLKYLAHAFIWGSFMHNVDGKALLSRQYSIKYLNESLSYHFLSDNAILLICTSLISIGFLFFWKVLLMMLYSPLLGPFYTMKRKKVNFF